MIYPQKLNSKKSNELRNILLISSLMIGITLVVINKFTTSTVRWAGIANAGIIYIWITVMYALKRHTNIAKHVLLQMLAISFVMLYIDNRLNLQGWAVYIGIPSIIMTANVIMLVLSIVGHKIYIKYAIYQLFIVLISVISIGPVLTGTIEFGILNKISIGVSLFNFVISLILSYKDFYRILQCKFHM